MHTDKSDCITKAVAAYVRETGLSIEILAQGTGISRKILELSFNKGTRRLRIEEFLEICNFFQKDPRDFSAYTGMALHQR